MNVDQQRKAECSMPGLSTMMRVTRPEVGLVARSRTEWTRSPVNWSRQGRPGPTESERPHHAVHWDAQLPVLDHHQEQAVNPQPAPMWPAAVPDASRPNDWPYSLKTRSPPPRPLACDCGWPGSCSRHGATAWLAAPAQGRYLPPSAAWAEHPDSARAGSCPKRGTGEPQAKDLAQQQHVGLQPPLVLGR